MLQMTRKALTMMLIIGGLFSGPAGGGEMPSMLKPLIEADRAFATMCETDGSFSAFMTFLADDAVVFRPQATNGKLWYYERGQATSRLSWWPSFADISAAGDLGFTTGLWEYRQHPTDNETFYGQYITVWRKQPDGQLRVILDIGISHEEPEDKEVVLTWVSEGQKRFPREESWNLLAATEQQLSHGAVSDILQHYEQKITPLSRFYREGSFPGIGRDGLQLVGGVPQNAVQGTPAEIGVAVSGDLGYAYGKRELRISETSGKIIEQSGYLRIWRRGADGMWRLLVDVAAPVKER